jgi:hypothetical protein
MKSHSRFKSYLILLSTSNHFEGFSADFPCIRWIQPSICAKFLSYYEFFFARHLSMSVFFLCLRLRNFNYFSYNASFPGASLIFRFFLLNMGAGSDCL